MMSSSPPVYRSPPVLLLLFNRPAVTKRLLAAVAAGRPEGLYVAADGPREDRPQDVELCRETRQLVDELDWPCRVHRLFRESNLGLQAAVTSALDWFFDQVEAGIVLEDDCLPAPGFFPFAGEILDRYADDSRIMHVSGLNMRPTERFSSYSYFFAGVGHIWGWATWRRAWRLNDPNMVEWPVLRRELSSGSPKLHRVLGRKFAAAYENRKSTWARIWYYTTVLHSGLAVVPSVNLVRNIGFGEDATHTKSGRRHPLRLEEWGRMPTPLSHPPGVVPNADYERYLIRYHKGSYRRQANDWMHAALAAFRGDGPI